MRRWMSLAVVATILLAPMGLRAYPNYNYRNHQGKWVRRPHHYKGNHKPNIPPTATCKDGSLSFSQTKQGTCSHHSGVKR